MLLSLCDDPISEIELITCTIWKQSRLPSWTWLLVPYRWNRNTPINITSIQCTICRVCLLKIDLPKVQLVNDRRKWCSQILIIWALSKESPLPTDHWTHKLVRALSIFTRTVLCKFQLNVLAFKPPSSAPSGRKEGERILKPLSNLFCV